MRFPAWGCSITRMILISGRRMRSRFRSALHCTPPPALVSSIIGSQERRIEVRQFRQRKGPPPGGPRKRRRKGVKPAARVIPSLLFVFSWAQLSCPPLNERRIDGMKQVGTSCYPANARVRRDSQSGKNTKA